MHRIVGGDAASPAAPQGIGRVLPLCFGNLKGLLAIPLLGPVQAALRTDFVIADTAMLLDSLQSLNDLPASGTVQLQAERIAYSSKDTATVALTGLVHGVDSTLPADHALGTPVTEVIPSHVFGFFENPQVQESPEPRFYHGGIVNMYVNKLLKAPATDPTHVVTPDDTAAIYDPVTFTPIHVGTIRVDMTDPVDVNSPFANPDSVAELQRQQQAQAAAARDFAAQTGAVGAGPDSVGDPVAAWEAQPGAPMVQPGQTVRMYGNIPVLETP